MHTYTYTPSSVNKLIPSCDAVPSRYTLEAASLDTYTDSNTRERRPYEADGWGGGRVVIKTALTFDEIRKCTLFTNIFNVKLYTFY